MFTPPRLASVHLICPVSCRWRWERRRQVCLIWPENFRQPVFRAAGVCEELPDRLPGRVGQPAVGSDSGNALCLWETKAAHVAGQWVWGAHSGWTRAMPDTRGCGCGATGCLALPPKFWGLPNVYLLELRENALSGTVDPAIAGAKNLSTLLLQDNRFTRTLPAF